MNPEESLAIHPSSYKTVLEEIFHYKPEKYIKNPEPVTVYHITDHDFEVHTPEGRVEGKKGDFLVRNSDGSMYPADFLVFLNNYVAYVEAPDIDSEPI